MTERRISWTRQNPMVCGILALAPFLWCGLCLVGAAPAYPHADLASAFKAAGFDPSAEGAAFFVACSDSHVNVDKKEGFPAFIVDEINTMEPAPAFLVITGDMICSASLSFGNRPNAAQKEKALAEFRMLKADLGRLREGVSVYMVPGNHDTYPGEKDAALLRQVFPEAAAYSERELAGVSLFFLNAGSSGDFDEAQREWLRKRTLALPAEREAILFVHQPALGATVSERGVAVGLSEAFADYRGPLWMLSGHHHRNSDAVFALPRTTVVQAAMTTCNLTGWGGPEKPGYWVYCLQDGTVKARIFRRYEKGYRVAPLPNRAKARPITPPFDGVDNVVKTVFVGDGDREYLVSSKAADVVSWWGYLSEVTYRFPASLFERTPTQIGILASLSHTHKDVERRGHVFLSGDGETWVEAELASPEKGVYTVPLPDTVRASDAIHVRVTGPGYKGGVSLAGFAFCAPPVE